MSANEEPDPTPPHWPADLIDAACAWIADQLGEPHPVAGPPVVHSRTGIAA
ncbi:hypothetical protein M3G91_18000 [Micromonospora chalcea]|uniref:hypothetical protein n=1 Tax=Micromonospora chalcea TaxID=1874 RepID=UPI0021A961B7|nr:hypothetical protein [Micromonospora chalcea]MCT2279511.1 hypothetical protein [Micromonospora chalcea]